MSFGSLLSLIHRLTFLPMSLTWALAFLSIIFLLLMRALGICYRSFLPCALPSQLCAAALLQQSFFFYVCCRRRPRVLPFKYF